MKKLAVALLFGCLALSAKADSEPKILEHSDKIDASAQMISLLEASYTQDVYFNERFNGYDLKFNKILNAYKEYLNDENSLNTTVRGFVERLNPFEEKRNPTYYSDRANELKDLLPNFVYANFIAGSPNSHHKYGDEVTLDDYDMDKEILYLGKNDEVCKYLSRGKRNRAYTLMASHMIKLDIKECPYVHMPIDVAEKLWGGNTYTDYRYILQVRGKGNGIDGSCERSKEGCLKIKPEQILVTIRDLRKSSDNPPEWSSDKVSFTIDD